jgi:hypothetical protein
LHWKNVACNYCIEKTSRVIIALLHHPWKNVACNSDEKNGECNFEGKKPSVMVKKTASVYSHGPSQPSYEGTWTILKPSLLMLDSSVISKLCFPWRPSNVHPIFVQYQRRKSPEAEFMEKFFSQSAQAKY